MSCPPMSPNTPIRRSHLMLRITRGRRPDPSLASQAGMTIMEILVSMSIMAVAAGATAFLGGAGGEAKMIPAGRAGGTGPGREHPRREAGAPGGAGPHHNPPPFPAPHQRGRAPPAAP